MTLRYDSREPFMGVCYLRLGLRAESKPIHKRPSSPSVPAIIIIIIIVIIFFFLLSLSLLLLLLLLPPLPAAASDSWLHS